MIFGFRERGEKMLFVGGGRKKIIGLISDFMDAYLNLFVLEVVFL